MINVFNHASGIRLLVLSAILALFTACATTAPTSETVGERAAARWQALLSEDFASAYEYLSPGYRSSVSIAQYQRTLLLTKVRWTGAKYIESDCEETICNVKISMEFTIYGAVPGVKSFDSRQTIEESWVLINGNWYHVPNN